MTEQEEAEEEFMKYLLDHTEEYFCDDVANEFLYDYFEEDEGCIFDKYHCKGCGSYDHCSYNEVVAEVESDNLYKAMQGEPPEKIFGEIYNADETEIITDGDIPF